MDRDETLNLLTGGPEGIRQWNSRRAEEDEIPSLTHANLMDADLSHADLSLANFMDANLSYADLFRADLMGVHLEGADLRRANLMGADLTRAHLMGADLSYSDLRSTRLSLTDLRHANLRGAFLAEAILVGAELMRANLSEAKFDHTIITSDLSEAIGLNEARHSGPSHVDIDSCILKFKDDLPVRFLRGCGLRDEEIDYFRARVGNPIRHYTCFISYSTADEDFATQLYNDFQAEGIRCWKWNKDAKTGESLIGEINTAIRVFNKLVLIVSKSALQSPAVIKEIKRAIEKEDSLVKMQHAGEHYGSTNVLFPVRIDDYVLDEWEHPVKTELLDKVIADARNWTDPEVYNKIRDRLIEELRK